MWVTLNIAEGVAGHWFTGGIITSLFNGHHGYCQGIDGQYLDGLSLTYGAPSLPQHIWTFASGLFSGNRHSVQSWNICPCNNNNTYPSPLFVGNDYFCESLKQYHRSIRTFRYYGYVSFQNDLLWDGQVCESGGIYCKFNNPPWFTKKLPNSTTDGIQLRVHAVQQFLC